MVSEKRKIFRQKIEEWKLITPTKKRCFRLRANLAQEASPTCHLYSNKSSIVKIGAGSDEENDHTHDNENLPTEHEQEYLPDHVETTVVNSSAHPESPVIKRLTIEDFRSCINGYCFITAANGEVSLLVSFFSSRNLIVRGCAVIEVLLGNICILDNLVREGDAVPIFAPKQCPSVIIQGSYSKSNFCGYKKVRDKFLPFDDGTQEDNTHEGTREDNICESTENYDSHEGTEEENSHKGTEEENSHKGTEEENSHKGTEEENSHKGTEEENSHKGTEEENSHERTQEENSCEGSHEDQPYKSPIEGDEETCSTSSVVSEAFKKKIYDKYLEIHGTNVAENKLESLNLIVGKRMVVLRLREFPLKLLGRTLRKLYPESVKPDHFKPTVYIHPDHRNGQYNALSLCGTRPLKRVKAKSLALPVYIPPSWQKVTQQLKSQATSCSEAGSPQIRVVVVGPSRSGKKTFTRYLINALLESLNGTSTLYRDTVEPQRCEHECLPSPLEPTPAAGVCVLDANLVCPMQCFPGAVSLCRYRAPVFGPAYEYGMSHVLRNCEHADLGRGLDYVYDSMLDFGDRKVLLPHEIKAIFIGKPDLLLMKYEFMDAVKSLCKTASEECRNEPLIFSCPSIREDYERCRFAELMEVVKPTHVVHFIAPSHGALADIASTRVSSRLSLDCDVVDKLARQFNLFENRIRSPQESGVCSYGYNYWLGIDPHKLHEVCYQYAGIPPVCGTFYKRSCPPSEVEQNIAVSSYFSALWPYNALTLDSRTVMKPYITPYETIAIEIKFGFVRLEDVVPTLEMRSMVALCSVDKQYIRDTGPGTPNEIVLRRSSPVKDKDRSPKSSVDVPTYTLHGWAVVQRVDCARQWIFLLVPRCFCPLLDGTVNALVLPHTTLPLNFDRLFYDDHLGNYRSIVPRGPWNHLLTERVNKIH